MFRYNQKCFTLVIALMLVACSASPARGTAGAPIIEYVPVPNTSPGSDVIEVRSAAPAIRHGYDALLADYPYPFEVHYFDFRSQDQAMQMAYMDETGANPNGKTVLLMHGENFCSAYWQRTIRVLSEHGYRVIAVDQIGFGKSTKPVRYQFSFATLASNTQRLLSYLGVPKVSIIGHSMGGMLAVRFALSHPQWVDRLILVSPLGLEDWQDKVPYQPLEETYHEELTESMDRIREYMRMNYYGGAWSALYEEPLELLGGWMNGPDRRLIAWDRALEFDMIFTQPVVHEFPLLAPQTLLIIGQRDRTAIGRARVIAIEAARLGDYQKLGRIAAKMIPHAKLLELPLAGHMPQVDSFDAYIAAVGNFLAQGLGAD